MTLIIKLLMVLIVLVVMISYMMGIQSDFIFCNNLIIIAICEMNYKISPVNLKHRTDQYDHCN
ncbi:hypothetical protein BA193_13060 [Yersinia pseudotuberculosis]|nr:hypothetical protein BA193_13060 [Yersinia pseudotuberculosis]PSH45767.1 hypothetical protein BA194_17825 [Yersinia pseudotuberculosis]